MGPAFLKEPPAALERLAGLLFRSSCVDCGAQVENVGLGGLCLGCWDQLPWCRGSIKGTRVAAAFKGSWREAIHAYKFYGRLSFRRPFARLLEGLAGGSRAAAVVGVPTSRLSLKERGYDPVEAMARPFARRLGLPYLEGALWRVRQGPKQALLSRAERLKNARGAYAAWISEPFRGKPLILVDDVMTTGATLSACATALKRSGASAVERLALASGELRIGA